MLYKSKKKFQCWEPGGLCRSHGGDLCLWCRYFRAIIHLFAKELHDACAELDKKGQKRHVRNAFDKVRRLVSKLGSCWAHLSVHEDIDNWVVNGGALCKVCRHGGSQRMEGIAGISRSKAGKEGVRSPADTVSYDHDNDHPGYFFLSLLCGLGFLLLHGNLLTTNQGSEILSECGLLIKLQIASRITYSANGQPHCKVAQDDDSQGNKAACNHKNNHVGLDSRVFTSTEYIGSTGSLQSMRPVPDMWKCLFSVQFVFSLMNSTHYLHPWSIFVKYKTTDYLLHPKMGGAHHTADQTQENTIPPVAHLASNLTFPKGLHTTIHLSQEMIVRDQRAVIPRERRTIQND